MLLNCLQYVFDDPQTADSDTAQEGDSLPEVAYYLVRILQRIHIQQSMLHPVFRADGGQLESTHGRKTLAAHRTSRTSCASPA